MTTVRRRTLNETVTRFWSLAAPIYDVQFVQHWVYRPAQTEVIAALASHGAARIADIACGTGILADRIDTELHPGQVYGVDMSVGMLAQARRRSSAVRWLQGPAEHLPFDDGTLDAVVTTSAFHFFDQPAALREFHRMLAPGGLAAVTVFTTPQWPLPLRWLASNPGNPTHNPSPTELRALFEHAGLHVTDQHRVSRPVWTQCLTDTITVGVKS